ncbi:hypothetical protein ACJX0J_034654, partial [Zea mays]
STDITKEKQNLSDKNTDITKINKDIKTQRHMNPKLSLLIRPSLVEVHNLSMTPSYYLSIRKIKMGPAIILWSCFR